MLCAPLCHPESTQDWLCSVTVRPTQCTPPPPCCISEVEGLWMISKASWSVRKSVLKHQRQSFTETGAETNLTHFHFVACFTVVHFCPICLHLGASSTNPPLVPHFPPPIAPRVSITAVDFAKGGFKCSLLASL